MNEDIIKGHWTELKGKIRKFWGRFTDDEVDEMTGSAQELQGRLQKKYGYSKEKAEEELKRFTDENDVH